MEKDEEVPPGGGSSFFGGVQGRLAARLTKGLPSDHWKSPSMVRSFKPIHWYSRYWSGGTGGGLGGTAGPQHPQTGLKGWRLFLGGGLGEAGKWGGVAGRGQQSPGVPSGPWWLWCPRQ